MADSLDLIGITQRKDIVESPKMDSAMRADGWKNVMSGMGTTRDKRRYTTYDFTRIMDPNTLTHLYIGDGLVARIVDTFSDDMTREWGVAENDPINK